MFWNFKNVVGSQSQVLAAAGLATIFALRAMRLFHNAAQSWNGSCIGKNALYARMFCQRATLNWWMVLNWDMEECCKHIPSSLRDLNPNVASKLTDWRNAGLITNEKIIAKPGPGKTLRQLAKNVGQGVRAPRQDRGSAGASVETMCQIHGSMESAGKQWNLISVETSQSNAVETTVSTQTWPKRIMTQALDDHRCRSFFS